MDTNKSAAFSVLEYVLLDAPGAPLKQALLDAGIGMDILSSYDGGVLQPTFSIIAKNANDEDEERFVSLIRSTLKELADRGLDEKAIRAAINIQEFRFREADYGTFPKGLMYGIDIFDTWLYDEERPFDALRQLDDFEFLKKQIGTGYYEELIRTGLLGNPHAALIVLSPERGLTTRMDKEVREKLDAFKASLTREQIQELVDKTAKLRVFQESPSSQEDLEKIPMLSREDLGREARPFRSDAMFADGAWMLHHAYETNGIAYIRLLFDASAVPAEDLPYLALLRSVIGFVDTEHYGYQELGNEINRNTGGVSAGLALMPEQRDTEKMYLAFSMDIRTLYDKIGYSFDMVREMLFTSNLGQEKRLKEILRRLVAGLGTRLAEAGSATAMLRSQAGFSARAYVSDCIGGVRFLEVMKDLEKRFDENVGQIKAKLRELLDAVLGHGRVLVSYTGDAEQFGAIKEGLCALMAQLPQGANASGDCGEADPQKKLDLALSCLKLYPVGTLRRVREGLTTPGKVQYVARTGNFVKKGLAYTGALKVLQTIMSYEYLWSNVRVVGGAYGCSAVFRANGDSAFTSYRDPQLRRTIEVFEGIPEYLRTFQVSDRDMTKYVIGTVSGMDTPLTPAMEGARSLAAALGRTSLAQLQKERDEVLSAGEADIRALAPLVEAVLEQGYLCVVGNEDRLREDAELFDQLRELS